MTSPGARARQRRAQRLRARAWWAFIIAAIGLGATLVGVSQYVFRGAVSIRPGHDPVQGSEAVAELVGLLVVSLGFATVGIVLRARAQRAVVFLPLEEALLEVVAAELGDEARDRFRQQVRAVEYVQRPLDWTEVSLYTSRDASVPWPEAALFADRSDDLKLARVRYTVDDETFWTDVHAVRGHLFSLVTRPSPRKVARRRPVIGSVDILADPNESPAGDGPHIALPPSYVEFVETHGAGPHRGWTILAAAEVYRISLPQGDFWVLAEREGEEFVLADDETDDPHMYRCEADGEPTEIAGLDSVFA